MSDKILFIIFPGFGSTIKHFRLNDVNGKFNTNSNFLSELKKMGKIYFVNQNYNNISYYDNNEKEEQYLFKKNINFTLKDLNMENICSKIYNDVKNFNGKYVLIGHSIGSFPLYYFSQKYSSKCIYNFLIDGTNWGPFYINKKIHNKLIKDCNKTTNENIQKLINEVKQYNSTAIYKLNNIIGGCLEKQMPVKAKKIKVTTYSFRNLQINEDPGGSKHSKKRNTRIYKY